MSGSSETQALLPGPRAVCLPGWWVHPEAPPCVGGKDSVLLLQNWESTFNTKAKRPVCYR